MNLDLGQVTQTSSAATATADKPTSHESQTRVIMLKYDFGVGCTKSTKVKVNLQTLTNLKAQLLYVTERRAYIYQQFVDFNVDSSCLT